MATECHDATAPEGYRVGWLLYAAYPPGKPPRRWRGLVGYGRLDIAARFLLASLYPGGVLLEDSFLALFLDKDEGEGPVLLFTPNRLPYRLETEEDAAKLILEQLRGRLHSCTATLRGFVLSARRKGYQAVLLSEDGEPMQLNPDTRYLFIVGSRVDPPAWVPRDEEWRIGCLPYLASTVASYINLRRLASHPTGGRDEG